MNAVREATNLLWHARATEFAAAIAWGLVVLGLTFLMLFLGAIVLPAQAYETPIPDGYSRIPCTAICRFY